MTLAEASILVGIPKGPSYYSPISHKENSQKRQKVVLSSMLTENYITKDEYDEALASEPVVIGEYPEGIDFDAPYYVDAVFSRSRCSFR